ncbi:MAG: sigma-70 family RNA polymerase sigma factor [Clostridia bacterium]
MTLKTNEYTLEIEVERQYLVKGKMLFNEFIKTEVVKDELFLIETINGVVTKTKYIKEIVDENKTIKNILHYYIYLNSSNSEERLEIDKKVAITIFQRFVRKERNLRRSDERHNEYSDVSEETINKRSLNKPLSLEEQVEKTIEIEKLHEAMDVLSEVQKRRIKMYYFQGLTFDEIASIEGCKYQQIQKSIYRAEKKIKKFFKK